MASDKANRPPSWSLGGRISGKQLLLFLLGGGGGILVRLRLGQALLELIHAAGGIYKLLSASIKRMTNVTNTQQNCGPGGAGFDDVATGATDFRVLIFGMDVSFHIAKAVKGSSSCGFDKGKSWIVAEPSG